jgi:hypothetical protein
MASNDAWVVPAGLDERRFFVLDVARTQQRKTAYFAHIAEQMDNGGREDLLWVLLHRDLGDWDHREAPNTKPLQDQKVLTLHPVNKVIYQMLATGNHPRSLVKNKEVFIVTEDLAQQTGLTSHALGRELRVIAGESIREFVDEQRRRGFWMPELNVARARWASENELGGLTWPRDVAEWDAAEEKDEEAGDW